MNLTALPETASKRPDKSTDSTRTHDYAMHLCLNYLQWRRNQLRFASIAWPK